MDFVQLILVGYCQAFVGVLMPAPNGKIAAAQRLLCVVASVSLLGFVIGIIFVVYLPNLPGISVIVISLVLMLIAAAGGNSMEKQIQQHKQNNTKPDNRE